MELIENLRNKLQRELTGWESHRKLAPAGRYALETAPDINAVKSAVLILLFKENNQFFFPVIQKTVYKGVHSGQISFPGGKAEVFDKDIIATAVRETEEEIGIDRNSINILGKLSPLYIPVSNFEVNPFVGYIDYIPEFYPNKSEVADLFKININDLIQSKIITRKVKVREVVFEAPFFIFPQTEIWGATAMILSEFADVLMC